MSDDTIPPALTLLDGLRRWGERKLVEDIELFEKTFTDAELGQNRWPRVGTPGKNVPPAKHSQAEAQTRLTMLSRAWDAAVHDLKRKITGGVLEMRGRPHYRNITVLSQTLPRRLSQQHHFDFINDSIVAAGQLYEDATIAERPVIGISAEDKTPDIGLPLSRPIRASDLSDDEIIDILNDHYERVRASPGPKMMARVKDVLQPFINGRMEFRAEHGLLETTLAAEAAVLQAWIKEVASSWHPIPKVGTVAENIRVKYAVLKARSKGKISDTRL